jgi:hypothetical protein
MMAKRAVAVAGIVCLGSACSTAAEIDATPPPAESAAPDETSEGTLGSATQAASTEDVCWRSTSVRGVGRVPSECPGAERDGALCYPFCPSGYKGVGPVCWQGCPAGYTDDGATCRRDAHIISADNSGCPWYDKCGLTLSKGCSKCPAGYANDGCTCRKDVHIFAKATTTRGAGSPMSCGAGLESDAGLCYSPCGNGKGVGPVCWMGCAGDMPVECGAGCARTQEACTKAMSEQVLKPLEAVVKAILQDWSGAVEKGIETANAYNLPICGAQ